jgi:hypothetical protein
VRFRGRLEIPGAPFTIPEQDFISSTTTSEITFESYPDNSWPKLLIELELDEPQGKVKSFIVRPSDNTVNGELLRTRVVFSMARADKWLLYTNNAVGVFERRHNLSTALDEQELLYRAKLYRKLKYIEESFGVRFSLPDTISGKEVGRIETIFRGITEGEFITRGGEITTPKILPQSNVDLTKPPFAGPGEFAYTSESPIKLLGKPLSVGPIKVVLKKSELANKRVLEQIRNGWKRPVDLRFIVYDHQILYRFEKFASQPQELLVQELDRFKQGLSGEEPKELVDLICESLVGNVSSDEATHIAMGWTLYHGLPDRYCPQEPNFNEAVGHWRVPIWLVYANGEGGPVGEVVIDNKTGEIIRHTPIEKLRSEGLALAEKILHA